MQIAISRADGGVSIMTVVDDASAVREVMRWADAMEGTPMAYVSHRAINPEDVPTERTFRDAWTDALDTATVDVDMPKAREIVRNRIREARKPLLEALDVEFMRADERADAAAKLDIAAQKQVLRDLPQDPRIEAAQTPDELKALSLI